VTGAFITWCLIAITPGAIAGCVVGWRRNRAARASGA
jgi:hypothetical protein